MSLINREIVDFKVQAFVNNEFKEVTKKDVLGKWSVFFFYPADFTFVCPTELEDLANKYEEFKKRPQLRSGPAQYDHTLLPRGIEVWYNHR